MQLRNHTQLIFKKTNIFLSLPSKWGWWLFKSAASIQWCHHSWLQPTQILFIGQTPGCDKSIYGACLSLAQLCKPPHTSYNHHHWSFPHRSKLTWTGPQQPTSPDIFSGYVRLNAICSLPPMSHCSQRCFQMTFFSWGVSFFFPPSSSFTPLLPSHICGAGRVDGLPLIAWLQLRLNGDDVSRGGWGGGGCTLHTEMGTHRRAAHKKRHRCVGGWENPAQHGMPEIRRYWMRQHRGLCYSSERSSAPVNLSVIAQIISQIITGFDANIRCVALI